MIGILEAEREEKKRAKYLEKLRQQNKNPADEEKKKLEFISRFCSKVIFQSPIFVGISVKIRGFKNEIGNQNFL